LVSPTPLDHFDRGKPFYPLVIVYTIGLHGLKELALRGLLDMTHEQGLTPTLDQLLDSVTTGNTEFDAGIRKLREPLSLALASDGARIPGGVGLTAREIAENHRAILPAMMPALGSILMLANEIVKQQLRGVHDPVLEFLFHARKPVAHGGRWHFQNGQPKAPASWRGLSVSPSLEGSDLFRGPSGAGMLGPGDPIRLLRDIEQKYPTLTV
jgi:hypothetical protein